MTRVASSDLCRAIKASLTRDLLKQEYQKIRGRNKFFGHCYVASELAYHMLGGRKAGWAAHRLKHEGWTHWWLKNKKTDKVLDLTARQFLTPVPYEKGIATGFLTKRLSKRARVLRARVEAKLSQKGKSGRS